LVHVLHTSESEKSLEQSPAPNRMQQRRLRLLTNASHSTVRRLSLCVELRSGVARSLSHTVVDASPPALPVQALSQPCSNIVSSDFVSALFCSGERKRVHVESGRFAEVHLLRRALRGKEDSDWGQKGLAECATDRRINLVCFYRPLRPGPHVAVLQCTTVDRKNTPLCCALAIHCGHKECTSCVERSGG
jgi:hypothetical protein